MKKNVMRLFSLGLIMAMSVSFLSGCAEQQNVFISGKADLVGKKIGVQEGTTGDLLATDEVEGAQMHRYKKAVDAALELKNGKIDAVVLDSLPAQRIVATMPELVILDEQLSEEEYAIAVRKGDTELLEAVNATLARTREDGTFKTLTDAFMPENGDAPIVPEARPASTYTESIIMGTNAEFEPFEFRSGDKIVGFDIEMGHEIANDLQKNLVVEDMAFDSLIAALSSGKIDMVLAGMTVSDERLESVDFSEPYFSASQVIIVRKTSVK